jgi:hypothetical protein
MHKTGVAVAQGFLLCICQAQNGGRNEAEHLSNW